MSLLHTDQEFQHLLQTKELYKQIFNCSVLPIILHDMYFNIIDVNDKVVEVFGYSKEEILSLKIFDLHTDVEIRRSLEVLEQMQVNDSMTVEAQFKRKDGSVFTAEASPCKIKLKRAAFIHVHLDNIREFVEDTKTVE